MSDLDRLAHLQHSLEAGLEERISSLLGQIQAMQRVTAQLSRTATELQRSQDLLLELEASEGADETAIIAMSDASLSLERATDGLMSQLERLGADLRGHAS
jgi:prefoldin subunit 5